MPQAEDASHILVIRLSAMGDVAMTVPVLRVLTASYPNLRITVLTRGFFEPMFKEIPGVSVY
ncbi:MAG: ADP-heptose--LPS heptosyltransferase RfaF, partial [Salegentibacter mishustinae]|nr:ADP-heptose--LPS heptosyltransferase RfaF [Salegentibacter mishustinae]